MGENERSRSATLFGDTKDTGDDCDEADGREEGVDSLQRVIKEDGSRIRILTSNIGTQR